MWKAVWFDYRTPPHPIAINPQQAHCPIGRAACTSWWIFSGSWWMKIMVLELAGAMASETAQPAWTGEAISSHPVNLAMIFLPQASRHTAGFTSTVNSKIPKKQSAVKHRGWKTLLKRSWPPVWSVARGWVLTLLPALFSPMMLLLWFWCFNLSSAQAKQTWAIWEGLVSVTLLWAWTLIMEPVWYGHGLAVRGMNGGDPLPFLLSLFLGLRLEEMEPS